MPADVTQLLNAAQSGDDSAAEKLLPLVYQELRGIASHKMANEKAGQTLQPTALVHEAWLRLGGDQQPNWENRAHFFGAAAEAMRRILIDRARKRKVREASGLDSPEPLEDSKIEIKAPSEELVAIHEVIDRLESVDADAAQLVKLRYFVGMNMNQTAEALDLSTRSAERLWTFAKAWLRDAMKRDG